MLSVEVLRVPYCFALVFFFNDTATTEIYTLSLHDALPIWPPLRCTKVAAVIARAACEARAKRTTRPLHEPPDTGGERSEEHTSELQSRQYLVCRLLLEKKTTPIHSDKVTVNCAVRHSISLL